MIGPVARNLLWLVVTLVVAALVLFVTLDVVPGDPARFILGINATDASVLTLRQQLGLDGPAWLRFFGWIGGMLTGDFGFSYTQNAAVSELLAGRLAVTVPLALLAVLLAAAAGLPLGAFAARRHGSIADRTVVAAADLGVAIPSFWLGMVLVLIFSVALRWLPLGGFVPWSESPLAAFSSLILPAVALALPAAAGLAHETRTALVTVQGSDYIRAARARGLTMHEAMRRHGFRNAYLPVLAGAGAQLGRLLAGVVIVENVFYLPGLGRLTFDAAAARDLILVRGAVMVLLAGIIGTMFLSKLAAAFTDPRLREGEPE